MSPGWMASASYPCSLEMSRRARLDASLLACRASATRSLSKSAKVPQTCCPFHSLFPDLPGLALLRLAVIYERAFRSVFGLYIVVVFEYLIRHYVLIPNAPFCTVVKFSIGVYTCMLGVE